MIKQIFNKDILYAIVIYSSFQKDGISFFTPKNFSQQLGYMNRPKGYHVKPHMHSVHERSIYQSQEVLFIKSGKLKIDFFDTEGEFLESLILNSGDIILLANGGHGIEWLEDGEVIEVKQGPYSECDDKIEFDTIGNKTNL